VRTRVVGRREVDTVEDDGTGVDVVESGETVEQVVFPIRTGP